VGRHSDANDGVIMFSVVLGQVENRNAQAVKTGYYPLWAVRNGGQVDGNPPGVGVSTPISTPGTFRDLIVTFDVAANNSGSMTLYKNGSATALTVSWSASTVAVMDATNEVSVVAGDTVCWYVDSGSTGTANWAACSYCCGFRGTYYNNDCLWGCANPNITLGTNANYYMSAGGQPVGTSSSTNSYRIVCPTAGVLKNLYVNLGTAPGAGTSRTCTLYKAGSAQTLTCTISNTATSASDTTHTVTVAAGDSFEFNFTLSGSPASTTFSVGMTFTSTNRGEVPSIGAAVNYTINATDYTGLSGALQGGNTEAQVICSSGLFSLKNWYALASGVPGQTVTIAARRTNADAVGAGGTMSSTIGSAATTANSTNGLCTAPRFTTYGTRVTTPSGANTVQISVSHTLYVFQRFYVVVQDNAAAVPVLRVQHYGVLRPATIVDIGARFRRYLMRGWSASLSVQREWWADFIDTGAIMYNGTGKPLTDVVILDIQ
jgi:hypothetical protein